MPAAEDDPGAQSRALDVLRRENRRLRDEAEALVRAVPFPLAMVGEGRLLTRCNAAFAGRFGSTEVPVALLDDEALARLRCELGQAEVAWRYEVEWAARGERRLVDIVARRVTGQPDAMLLCLQDRDAARARRDRQRRMGSLGAVAAGLVEDMLDPVTVMKVNLEQLAYHQPVLRRAWSELRSEARDRDRAQAKALDQGARALQETGEIVSECEHSVGRLDRVLRAVRDFVEHDKVAAPGAVEVADALDAALQLTRGPLRPQCETRVAYGPLGQVWAVRGDVEQVLVALLMAAAGCFEGWGVLEVDGGLRGEAVEVSIGVEGTDAGRRLGALELDEPAELLERYEGGLEYGRTPHGAQLTLRLPRLVGDAS